MLHADGPVQRDGILPALRLLVPYAAWLAYAAMLNGAIWRLNA